MISYDGSIDYARAGCAALANGFPEHFGQGRADRRRQCRRAFFSGIDFESCDFRRAETQADAMRALGPEGASYFSRGLSFFERLAHSMLADHAGFLK